MALTWTAFPAMDTDNFNTAARSVLELWRSNGASLETDIIDHEERIGDAETSIGSLAAGSGIIVSANDTTVGNLETKVLPGTGILMTTQDDGGDETRTITAKSYPVTTQTLTGSGTWTYPAGVYRVRATCVGGGAGGHAAYRSGSTYVSPTAGGTTTFGSISATGGAIVNMTGAGSAGPAGMVSDNAGRGGTIGSSDGVVQGNTCLGGQIVCGVLTGAPSDTISYSVGAGGSGATSTDPSGTNGGAGGAGTIILEY